MRNKNKVVTLISVICFTMLQISTCYGVSISNGDSALRPVSAKERDGNKAPQKGGGRAKKDTRSGANRGLRTERLDGVELLESRDLLQGAAGLISPIALVGPAIAGGEGMPVAIPMISGSQVPGAQYSVTLDPRGGVLGIDRIDEALLGMLATDSTRAQASVAFPTDVFSVIIVQPTMAHSMAPAIIGLSRDASSVTVATGIQKINPDGTYDKKGAHEDVVNTQTHTIHQTFADAYGLNPLDKTISNSANYAQYVQALNTELEAANRAKGFVESSLYSEPGRGAQVDAVIDALTDEIAYATTTGNITQILPVAPVLAQPSVTLPGGATSTSDIIIDENGNARGVDRLPMFKSVSDTRVVQDAANGEQLVISKTEDGHHLVIDITSGGQSLLNYAPENVSMLGIVSVAQGTQTQWNNDRTRAVIAIDNIANAGADAAEALLVNFDDNTIKPLVHSVLEAGKTDTVWGQVWLDGSQVIVANNGFYSTTEPSPWLSRSFITVFDANTGALLKQNDLQATVKDVPNYDLQSNIVTVTIADTQAPNGERNNQYIVNPDGTVTAVSDIALAALLGQFEKLRTARIEATDVQNINGRVVVTFGAFDKTPASNILTVGEVSRLLQNQI